MYLSKNLNIRFFCLFAFCLFLKELMHTYAHTIYIYLIKNTAKKCNIMINFDFNIFYCCDGKHILLLLIFIRKMYYSWMHQIDQSDIYIYIRMISEC